MAVRRQRVAADNDPLSLFLSQSAMIEAEDDEEIQEKIETHSEPKSHRLINSLAPEKPIEYEPTPPVRQPITVPIIHETIKVEAQKELQKEKALPSPPALPTPAPIPSPVMVTQTASNQEKHVVKTPAAPNSIFETDDDIFLKKAPQKKEDDFFGADGELSELKFISTKVKSNPVKLDENDSDEDEKVYPHTVILLLTLFSLLLSPCFAS
jgi:secreted Zn-dependent insulinase-like peptidase